MEKINEGTLVLIRIDRSLYLNHDCQLSDLKNSFKLSLEII